MPIKVKIGGDASGFRREMKGVRRQAKGLGSSLKSAFLPLAGLLSARMLTGFVNDLATTGDEIGKAAKKTGVSAEEFQKLAFAARRAGASSNDVEKAFKRMSSTIFDANKGIKESEDALKGIGVELSSLRDKSTYEQFTIIADALGRVEDSTTKAALAQDLFGRAGTNIIPMLNDYKALGKELEDLGGIISNDNVKAAEDFKDAMEDLSSSIKGATVNSGLLKWLADAAGGMSEIARAASSLDKFFDAVGTTIEEDVLGWMMPQIPQQKMTTTTDDERAEFRGKARAKKRAVAEAAARKLDTTGTSSIQKQAKQNKMQYDQFRRIGAVSGGGGMSPTKSAADAIEKYMPAVVIAIDEIRRKQPEPSTGAKY